MFCLQNYNRDVSNIDTAQSLCNPCVQSMPDKKVEEKRGIAWQIKGKCVIL